MILVIASACLFSGCARKDNVTLKGPARATLANYKVELEKQLAQKYTVTTEDGTHWKAFVTQVHEDAGRYYGVIIFGPPESEWEMGLLRYDAAKNDWDKSATKVEHTEVEDYTMPDTASTAKQWGVPKEKLDAWIAQAEATMKKKMGQS